MKEIRDILDTVGSLPDRKGAVLATVFDVQGSSYRLPGARMLIVSDGRAVGTVSGGCLEADVLERAKRVLDTGRPEVFVYDTTGKEDSVFSLNMGCRGIIRILIEPIDRNSQLVAAFRRVREDRQSVLMATVISGDHALGERFFWSEKGGLYPGPRGSAADIPTVNDVFSNFAKSGAEHSIQELDFSDGECEAAFERLSPPVKLMIFGAGADAVPLARLAHELGWQVAVADHRPAYITKDRFPTAEQLILEERVLAVNIAADYNTAIVVMTHNFDRDRLILPAALSTPAFYIGVLGPKSRSQQLLEEVFNEPGAAATARLFAPVGLDIGGHTPETIALAITAEIQSVLRSRSGGHLRQREGSIYDRA